jgi:uncharacterized protein
MSIRTSLLVQGAIEGRRGTHLVAAWFIAVILSGTAAALLQLLGLWRLGNPEAGSPASLLVVLPANAAVIVLIALWVTLWERRPFRSVGLRSGRWPLLLIGGFAGGALLFSIPAVILLLTSQLADGAAAGVTTSGSAAVAVVVALIPFWFVQAGAEEIAMRGYLLQRHAIKQPAWLAIGIVSVGFAVIHLSLDPIVLANTVLVSVFLCFVALAQGSLWAAIGIHAGWNVAQGHIFGIPVSRTAPSHAIFALGPADGAPTWLTGSDYGLEGSLAVTVTLFAACAAAYMSFRRSVAR